jgi:hypothetical protein
MSERRTVREGRRTRSLQQAASIVFVLTTVLPLLIFVWVLHSLDAMGRLHAQIGIVLSLVISMLGFAILRTVMRRASDALHALVRATAHDAPVVRTATHNAPPQPTASRPAPSSTDYVPASAQPSPAPASAPHPAPASAATSEDDEESAPAIGSIQELHDAVIAVARQWRREAEPLIGRPVLVYAKNFGDPETGTLVRVTDDGLVLDNNGSEFGVLWRFVSAIEENSRAQAAAAATQQPVTQPT